MRDEFEKIVIYTDTLQAVLEGAFNSGAYFSTCDGGIQHIDVEAKRYAAEKIQHIREQLALEFMHSHASDVVKMILKADETVDNVTPESLESMGFGVAASK